jgi:hypothetical protein
MPLPLPGRPPPLRQWVFIGVMAVLIAVIASSGVLNRTQPQTPSDHHHRQARYEIQSGRPDDNQTFWHRTWSDPNVFFAACVAMFTAVLAVATIFLWITTIRMGRRQEWWMRKHERAYVNIGFGGRKEEGGRYVALVVTIANYGRTPAFIKEVAWGLCLPQEWPVDSYANHFVYEEILTSNMEKHMDQPTGPNGVVPVSGNSDHIFYARVIYNDVFGIEHFSSCRHRILADRGLTSIALEDSYSKGWDYDPRQKKTDPP